MVLERFVQAFEFYVSGLNHTTLGMAGQYSITKNPGVRIADEPVDISANYHFIHHGVDASEVFAALVFCPNFKIRMSHLTVTRNYEHRFQFEEYAFKNYQRMLDGEEEITFSADSIVYRKLVGGYSDRVKPPKDGIIVNLTHLYHDEAKRNYVNSLRGP